MKLYPNLIFALLGLAASPMVLAECVIAEDSSKLDPVEVGFCESDAVFVAKSEGAIETISAFTPEGSTTTKHFRVQRSKLQVLTNYKGEVPDKVTMIADLYAKDAYVFKAGKTYLVFAKRLAGQNEFAGATAKCSRQSTLHIEDADHAIKRLEQHNSGRPIDCRALGLGEKRPAR
jgi:hypothetical protein